MIRKGHITRAVKRGIYYSTVTIFCIVILVGGWCVPPKLLEKVIRGMKVKFSTEEILKYDRGGRGEDPIGERRITVSEEQDLRH
jgi:hypothetical protein